MSEMSDSEVRDQVARADAFVKQLRDAIAGTIINPESLCADAQRRTLRKITETMGAVPFVTFANLSNIDTVLDGLLMELIEVNLMTCGTSPEWDFADAASFLRRFEPIIDVARKRRLN